jgi:hypothetical protein
MAIHLFDFLHYALKIMMVFLAILMFSSCHHKSEKREEESAQHHEESKIENFKVITSTLNRDLALHWAPVHLQDTDVTGSHGLHGKSDYLAAINFDNDWNATNNWNNILHYQPTGHAYYSVVETATHWFIIYAFFHPRDWTDIFFLYSLDEHENDLEGFLAVVAKDGSSYGNLQSIVTVAHSDFYAFVPQESTLRGNLEAIEGILSFETYNSVLHPVTAQEAKGHGLKAYPYFNIKGDGIKYYPSYQNIAEAPSHADDRFVFYKLVDIFESGGVWDQRFNTNLFFSASGVFKSSYGFGKVNAPWAWDDNDDIPLAGELATDPAKVANSYFKNLGNFSLVYTNNGFNYQFLLHRFTNIFVDDTGSRPPAV